jgi:GcrA cell cycle regulator
MVWTDETISQLRALWAEGLSTAEIGRRLGVTKNAIVGKAHRLDLDARPSPIRRDAKALGTVAQARLAGPTLPPLASAAPSAPSASGTLARPLASSGVQSLRIVPATQRPTAPLSLVPKPPGGAQPAAATRSPSLIPPHAAPPTGRARLDCCWPLGEPGTKTFRFCDEGALPGKPYCEEHVKLAYVRVKDRREDAA